MALNTPNSRPKDALDAAKKFAKAVGANQKNIEIENEDGSKRVVTLKKWTVSEQLRFLPTFGMLFSPIIEKFTNVIFSASGRSNAGDAFENEITSEALLSSNSVYMFFQFLASEGNMEAILELVLKDVYVQGKDATLDSFEDIDQVLLVTVEVLKLNYGRLLSGKGFTGFLNVSTALNQFQQE